MTEPGSSSVSTAASTSVGAPSPETQALAALVHLGRRAREARDAAELGFVAVNETVALAPFRQGALWLREGGVTTLSGVVSPEANAPYLQWLGKVFLHLAQHAPDAHPRILARDDLPENLAAEWSEWLPGRGVWLPLPARGRAFAGGGLLLARDEVWTEPEAVLLAEWAGMLSQAQAALGAGRGWRRWFGRPLGPGAAATQPAGIRRFLSKRWVFTLALVGALFIPVHLTVLAPAELVPLNPAVIRAPLDGVVDRVLVTPNQAVKADAALFEFDRANIQNRLQIALRALGTVQAEYRQKAQQALFDPASKAQLAVLQSQIAEKNTEVTYLRKLNERGVVVAPRDGVVLFDDPTEWVGRPVVTGERIMVVADEHAVEIEAWLSPADAIPLADGARVSLYLNADPTRALPARLRYLGHEALPRPDGSYAYRVRASLVAEGQRPRVGLKGTAKLEGEQVSLGYWMLRRPIAAARAWLGV